MAVNDEEKNKDSKTKTSTKKSNTSKKKTNSNAKKGTTQKKKNSTSVKKNNDSSAKKENINSKKKNVTKSKETKDIKISKEEKRPSKEEIFTEHEDVFEKIELTVKKNINSNIILIIMIVLLSILTYFLIPKIRLKGNIQEVITYNHIYHEKGYTGKWLFKDITDNIEVTSNLNTTKIGIYKITYRFKYGIFNIYKQRIIKVIDNVKPEITVDSETINICPNDEIPEIKYQANDEYDGDITNKVVVNYGEDKISLQVFDNSLNETNKEVIIDRIDKTNPEISLKGNSTIYLSVGSSYQESGYIANDNCDGDLTDKVIVSGSVGNNIGDYTITYSVEDNAGNKAEVTRKVIRRNYNLYNSGTIGNGVIYLTFDDGPSEGTTNVILDILKEEGIKATFFVTCNGPDYLIKRIYDEGHTVALHTCTHEYSQIYSSVDNYFNDLNRVHNRVMNITGVDAKIIRFPGGSSNTISRNYRYGIMSTLTSMVLDKGYRYFDWNIDSNDAGGANTSRQVYNNVVNSLSFGRSNVVLMHDIKYQTRDALRDIIRYGKSQGYLFGRLENDTYMIRHSVNN